MRRILFLIAILVCASVALADCLAPAWEVRPAPDYATSFGRTLLGAHLDEDDILDVIVTTNTKVLSALGAGGGSFPAPADVYTPGVAINEVAVNDLNGDGKLDLLVFQDVEPRLQFLAGNGDGTFAPPVASAAPMLGTLFAMADFTGDGKLDIVGAASYGPSVTTLVFLTGSGNGTFAESSRLSLATPLASAIAADDLDADGANDLVLSYLEASSLDILFGNGDGTFEPPVSKENGGRANRFGFADLDDDGHLDILAANQLDAVALHRNRGGRLFDAAIVMPVSSPLASADNAIGIGGADVTGDGVRDVVVTAGNGFIATFRGTGGWHFAEATTQYYGNTTARMIGAITDLDGDERLDVLTAFGGSGRIVALLNRCGDTNVTLEIEPVISAGQTGRYQVRVSGVAGFYEQAAEPTGTVSILEGETVLATGSLSASNVALTISGLALGDHPLVARYSGDAQYEPATSAISIQRVTNDTTTSVLSVNPSESMYGQSVGASVAVTASDGTTPTGIVDITFGSESRQPSLPSASMTLVPLAGTYTVSARYRGDASHPPSEAEDVTHVVQKAPADVSITRVQATNVTGSSAEVLVTVEGRFGGTATGTIELFDRNQKIATATLPASGFTVSGLAPGRHDFRAKFLGDANLLAGESPFATHFAFATSGPQLDVRGNTDTIEIAFTPPSFPAPARIVRAVAPNLDFAPALMAYASPDTDFSASAGVVYLYRVEWRDPDTNEVVAQSPIDLGVRMSFNDDPLLPGMSVRAAHLQEIVDATNFLRGKAGQSLVLFNDLAAGQPIRASHVTTLRTRINEARVALGAAPYSFTNAVSPGVVIRALDLQELREAVH